MAFRDDLTAAQSRADALDRENAELRAELEKLKAGPPPPPPPPSSPFIPIILAVILLTALGGLGAAVGLGAATWLAVVITMVLVMGGLITVSMLYAAPAPGSLLIISGRRYGDRGYQIAARGRLLMPMIERADRMDARPFPVALTVSGAYTKGNQPVTLEGSATVRVSQELPQAYNAVERFLGRGTDEIGRVAAETLQGHIRGQAAQLTSEELAHSPDDVADLVVQEAADDFDKLGLVVDALTLKMATGPR